MKQLIKEYELRKLKLLVLMSEIGMKDENMDKDLHKRLSIKSECYRHFILDCKGREKYWNRLDRKTSIAINKLLKAAEKVNPNLATDKDGNEFYRAFITCDQLLKLRKQ